MLRPRTLRLDATSGLASIDIQPGWLAGHASLGTSGHKDGVGAGPYTISIGGQQIDTGGTALTSKTSGTMILAAGSISVAGQPNDDIILYFDWST